VSERQRTLLQNRAAHKYFRLMADEMIKHDITQRLLFESFKDMEMTEHSVKLAFQRVALAQCGTDKTHKLSTKEMTEVYDIFDFYINQQHGVSVDWPSNSPPMIVEHEVSA